MILGTRGIPAMHGGFETFAEDLSLFLTARNHQVTVYCQAKHDTVPFEDDWNGVHRVHIPSADSAAGTVSFDWLSARHSSTKKGVVLTLGYNTGIFSVLYRLRNVPSIMNMDGIEWRRQKWSFAQRSWLRLNEWAGARLANHLVADHPEIAAHLRSHTSAKKITVIPYGADAVVSAPAEPLSKFNLASKGYNLVIARPEPENSILEIVQASSASRLRVPLVVLGHYSRKHPYHRQVKEAAGDHVKFLGSIFDRDIVRALRFHAGVYIHGHRVGGTNPSLVESLAAGSAIIAHDNRFNRWVAGENQRFFKGRDDLMDLLEVLAENPGQVSLMREASRLRHQEAFTQEKAMLAYESALMRVAAGVRAEVSEIPVRDAAGRWS